MKNIPKHESKGQKLSLCWNILYCQNSFRSTAVAARQPLFCCKNVYIPCSVVLMSYPISIIKNIVKFEMPMEVMVATWSVLWVKKLFLRKRNQSRLIKRNHSKFIGQKQHIFKFFFPTSHVNNDKNLRILLLGF